MIRYQASRYYLVEAGEEEKNLRNQSGPLEVFRRGLPDCVLQQHSPGGLDVDGRRKIGR